MKFFILVLLFFLKYSDGQICKTDQSKIKYYEEMIKDGILKSLNYELPASANEFRPNSDQVEDFGEFDFIIIGAGSTGAVIANRLCEIKKWKILLLEAGDDTDEFVNIPAMNRYILSSKYNWNFITIAGNCLGTPNRRCAITRGKALGGSTAINSMVCVRGHRENFDQWERDGNKGWSYKDVLPYFIKSENCQFDGDPGYHGKGGYLSTQTIGGTNIQLKTMMKANKQLFNYTTTDHNGKCNLGMTLIQSNRIRGQRQSVARAFLLPFENRKSLLILRHAYATKILIANEIAYGVEFAHNGTLFHAFAKKEVIVCAGGLQSPQLLMLSGIGPREHLEKLNISLIKDLPVGRSFRGQPTFGGLYVVTNYTEPAKTLKQHVEEYIQHQGELTTASYFHGMGLYQSTYANVPGLPDIRFQISQSNSLSGILRNITNGTPSAINERTTFSILIFLLNAVSLGTLKLNSKDPYTYPSINANYFNNTQDLEVMYQAVKIAQRLVESPEMRKLNASFHHNNYPQCANFSDTTKDFWFCAFKYSMASLTVHGLGSCRMGPNPNTSVVNNKLQVHGIQRLRVAGDGIVPTAIGGATATMVMIGEKISDDIKRHYNERIERIENVFGFNN